MRPTDIWHVNLQTATRAGNQELWCVSNKVITGWGKIRTSGRQVPACWRLLWVEETSPKPPTICQFSLERSAVCRWRAVAARAFLSAYWADWETPLKSDSNNNDPLERVEPDSCALVDSCLIWRGLWSSIHWCWCCWKRFSAMKAILYTNRVTVMDRVQQAADWGHCSSLFRLSLLAVNNAMCAERPFTALHQGEE